MWIKTSLIPFKLGEHPNMEVFVWRNIPPMETNAVDLDLLQFSHSRMPWKVMISVRENRFGEDSC